MNANAPNIINQQRTAAPHGPHNPYHTMRDTESPTVEDFRAWSQSATEEDFRAWRKAAHSYSDKTLAQLFKRCRETANEMHRKNNPVKAQFYEDLEWMFTDIYCGRIICRELYQYPLDSKAPDPDA